GLASSHYHLQNLLFRRADGNEQSAALPQLAAQRLGQVGRPRAHKNRVVRRISPLAECAVTRQVGNVAELEFREDFHGQVQKRLDPLDSEYLGAQLREQGCLVSRSRADLQNTLGTFQLQQLQVSGMNGRLRDGLSAADWERGVLVGTVPHARWYEQVSRYGLEGFEHALIVDPVPAQSLDKAPAGCHIPGFYRECH